MRVLPVRICSIELCSIATEHHKDALHVGWQIGLAVLSFFRRWVFLSALSVTVPMLVIYQGGDTLSICFNSVVSQLPRAASVVVMSVRLNLFSPSTVAQAVLFMCEVDNIAYSLGLSERIRARVEDAARITMTDGEASLIVHMKLVHTSLISAGCVLTVYIAGGTYIAGGSDHNGLFEASLIVLPCAFWAGAVLELFGRGHTAPQLALGVLKTTGARIISLPVAMFIIGSLFFPMG